MLKLEHVSKFYSANGLVSTGFSKVDLEFHKGEFVAITGESGSGKSTLLNVISGLDSYEEGEMFILGEATSGYVREDLEEYRKKYIGNIFQTFNLINSYTVYQNIELVLLLSGYEKKQIPARVKEIIEKVGLSGYEKKKASKLSGGQKQRVAIARALAKETPIIVADEPTGNLDSRSAAEIIRLLHDISSDKLVIIVTHNYEQVESYVTRKITMHDGRVAEDKQLVPEIERLPSEGGIQTAKSDSLHVGSQVRLGVRNTFNLPAKFMLMLLVFIFLCGGVIAQYASTQNMGDSMLGGWNDYFSNTTKNRILVTKEDRSEFTEEDYHKLSAIENVDYIVENDLMLDLSVTVTEDYEKGEIWICAMLTDITDYESQLAEGRLPKNSSEAVLMLPHGGYIDDCIEDVYDEKMEVLDDNSEYALFNEKVKIVGYGYLTDTQAESMAVSSGFYLEGYLCVNEEAMNEVRFATLEKYCTQEIHFADQIVEGGSGMYDLRSNEEVPEGQVYIPEELAYLSTYNASGQDLELINKSIYFEDTFPFTVGAVYNEYNSNYYLGINDKEIVYEGALYINPEDYGKIFDKGNFQSSVMTLNEKQTKETAKAIEKAGYKTFVVNEAEVGIDDFITPIYRIMRTLTLGAVLVVLFFITYFIVKLILKSRNIYFSTIRMLGATKENCSSLLKIELFVVFNIAFAIWSSFIYMIKKEIIAVEVLNQMAEYLEAGDFVILYTVLSLMCILLAARYAKQLFKPTAMSAYREEV